MFFLRSPTCVSDTHLEFRQQYIMVSMQNPHVHMYWRAPVHTNKWKNTRIFIVDVFLQNSFFCELWNLFLSLFFVFLDSFLCVYQLDLVQFCSLHSQILKDLFRNQKTRIEKQIANLISFFYFCMMRIFSNFTVARSIVRIAI